MAVFFYGRLSAPKAEHAVETVPASPLEMEATNRSSESEPISAPAGLEANDTMPEISSELSTPEPPSEFAARANEPMQTLTNTQGVQIQAKVLSVSATDVTIRRSDGLETTIPLSVLSADDVEFCEYLRETGSLQQTAPKSTSDIDWDAIFGS